MVSSCTLWAAARMRSGVTCRSSAAISSGVSRRPVAAAARAHGVPYQTAWQAALNK